MIKKFILRNMVFSLAVSLFIAGVFTLGTASTVWADESTPKEAADYKLDAAFADYSAKNGIVYNGNEEIGSIFYEESSNPDFPAACWAVVDEALLFFAKDGKAMASIIDENMGLGYVDVLWSTDGSHFVVIHGGGVRNFYIDANIYGPGMELKKEISTLREDGVFWLDGNRLVYTELGDIREGGAFPMNDIKLSVVLYDAATGKSTVLKEAVDNQNFALVELSEDGKEICITEFTVKSPDDWADEEKTEALDITIPVPATE